MADKDVNEITAALEDAASEAEESSTDVEENEDGLTEELAAESTEKSTKPKSSGKGKGAQDRIRELVSENKELSTMLEKVRAEKEEKDNDLGKLVDQLEAREEDHKVIQRINDLYNNGDESLKELIVTLDKAIRGEEIEAAKQEEAGEDASKSKEIQEMLKTQKQTLEERLADQQHDLIIHKADLLADNYINALHEEFPDDYNEEDERIIRKMLVDNINWDAVDENPDSLQSEFHAGFQTTLEDYGTPRGSYAKKVPTNDEDGEPKAKEPEFDLDAFARKEWGKLKEVERNGKTFREPVISDDDFVSMAAKAMREENQRRRE